MRYLRTPLAAAILVLALPMAAGADSHNRTLPDSREQFRLSFAPLVKRVAPAVVNIRTRTAAGGPDAQNPLMNDPFYRRFFGNPEQGQPASVGSGVILKPDGVIVTNHHVVRGGAVIEVILQDKRQFTARVLVQDERTDLAILKIDTQGQTLPFLELGDADKIEVGDFVLAIGNPFGVGQTVTSGIVSAIARSATSTTDLRSFIQTDAAINPGNSGGALVTLDGKLIGINTAIISRSGGNLGIGFAIPANMVQAVMREAERGTGTIRRPTLGIAGQDVTAEIAREMKLDRIQGVVVKEVAAGSTAERAGLKVNDVIVKLNGRDLADIQELRFRLATLEVGTDATVTVVRAGQEITVSVKLEATPDSAAARTGTALQGNNPFAGAEVAALTPALAQELQIRDTQGVVVLRVAPRSRAQQTGLRPGDVLIQVNGVDIASVDVLRQALTQGGLGWQVALKRQGRIISAFLQ